MIIRKEMQLAKLEPTVLANDWQKIKIITIAPMTILAQSWKLCHCV